MKYKTVTPQDSFMLDLYINLFYYIPSYSNKMYAPGNVKRAKTAREQTRTADTSESFAGVGRIEYKPDVAYNADDLLYYRYYSASERIHGRPFEDWLRPSIFVGRCFTPYPNCVERPWCDNTQSVESYKKSLRAVFELCIKSGVKFWSGYDRDLAPEGDTLEETQSNYDQVVDMIAEYQQKTGIRPLWIGVDFKNHPRYKSGAATNSDANIVMYSCHQVKRTLDIAHKLKSENFLLSCEQEGYENLINSDLRKEMKHYSRFMKMIVDYRDRIGYRGQLLIQTSQNKNGQRKYNDDLFGTLTFLKHYNLDHYYKANVQNGQDFYMANLYGSLGSVDVKGKDLTNVSQATLMLRTIIENGGVAPGGLTFYVPDHDGTFEAKDLAEHFVTSIDMYAKAFRLAVKLVNDVQVNKSIQMRYVSFTSGWGAKFTTSDLAFEESEDYIKKLGEGMHVQSTPTRSEHWTNVLVRYMDAPLK